MFVRRHLVRAGGGQAKTAAALRPAIELASQVLLGIVTAVCLVVALTAAAPLLGYRTYIVYGGSMGASLTRGSLAVTQLVDVHSLRVGDIIALKRQGSVTLHRITSLDIEDGQPVVTTRGDANEAPDPAPAILTGGGDRVVFSVPYLGYLLHFARGPLGRVLLIAVPLIALAVLLWRERGAGQGNLVTHESSITNILEQPAARVAPRPQVARKAEARVPPEALQAPVARKPEQGVAPEALRAPGALPLFLARQASRYRSEPAPPLLFPERPDYDRGGEHRAA